MSGGNLVSSTLASVTIMIIWICCLIGWIMNVVQVIKAVGDPVNGMFVVKCVGILMAPLGSVLGWVGFF